MCVLTNIPDRNDAFPTKFISFLPKNSWWKIQMTSKVARWTWSVGCGTVSGVTWKLGEVSFSFGIDSDELWDLVHVT